VEVYQQGDDRDDDQDDGRPVLERQDIVQWFPDHDNEEIEDGVNDSGEDNPNGMGLRQLDIATDELDDMQRVYATVQENSRQEAESWFVVAWWLVLVDGGPEDERCEELE
jgi:hypothetical protein